MNLLLIAIGGAIGSVARSVLATFVLRTVGATFPFGTFLVNAVGCVLFGAIMGAAQERFVLSPETRAFLLIGVLGGFTTFSSYVNESFGLMRAGQFVPATLNLVGQVVVGFVGFWAGFTIAGFS